MTGPSWVPCRPIAGSVRAGAYDPGVGQTIAVTEQPAGVPGVRIYVCDRSVTGMAIERYPDRAAAGGDRPPDVLARRLFDLGAQRVTVYSNTVTVHAPEERWAELAPRVRHTIEHLFEFYGDEAGWSFEARGVEPPTTPAVT